MSPNKHDPLHFQKSRKAATRRIRAMIRVLSIYQYSEHRIASKLYPFVGKYNFSLATIRRVLKNVHNDALDDDEWEYCPENFVRMFPKDANNPYHQPSKYPVWYTGEHHNRRRNSPPVSREEVTIIVEQAIAGASAQPKEDPPARRHSRKYIHPINPAGPPPVLHPVGQATTSANPPVIPPPPTAPPLNKHRRHNPTPQFPPGYLVTNPIQIDLSDSEPMLDDDGEEEEEEDMKDGTITIFDKDVRTFLASLPGDLSHLHPKLNNASLGTARELFVFQNYPEGTLHDLLVESIPSLVPAHRYLIVQGLKGREGGR